MKKYFLVIIATFTMLITLTSANAERKIWMHSNSGNHVGMDITDFDSISFMEPSLLTLSEYNRKLDAKGGSFNLDIHTNQTWKAETNNPIALSLSKHTGIGDGSITVTAMENTGTKSYSAIITITLLDGTYQQVIVTVLGTERGYLKINPEIVNLSSAGGAFVLNIEANQAWTAEAGDPYAVTLSKQSGTDNATISATVCPNADKKVYTEYVTVELEDGTKKQMTINVSIINEYVSSDVEWKKTIEKKGDLFDAHVYSNTIWSIESNQPWITISPASSKYNDEITVNVEANPNNDDEDAILTFHAIGGSTTEYTITREGDRVSVVQESQIFPPEGGKYKMGVTSNTDWSVSANESWVSFDKTSGTLNDSIVVTIDKADKDSASATITVTTTNGKVAQCYVMHENDKILATPSSEKISFDGGSVNVTVSSNIEWTASADRNWVTLSHYSGNGDSNVDISVKAGVEKSKCDSSLITFSTLHGKTAEVRIFRTAYTGSGDAVTDINGRVYPTIWINGQNWMAENLKCNKYDTESEAYNASWLTNNTVPTSESNLYTPYYMDATDKTKWNPNYDYSDNLSCEQIEKLGYLCNWAAAVGVDDGKNQSTAFTGNRQGICPNGWHIPTRSEWQTLYDYIYEDQRLSKNHVGKYISTISGWYKYCNGTDNYGFAALPSGLSDGGTVSYIGEGVSFWTATPSERNSDVAYYRETNHQLDQLSVYYREKNIGKSVRCLKD